MTSDEMNCVGTYTFRGIVTMDSFVINVLDNRNHTWQGTITWVESDKKQNFRSALELIELMDSVIGREHPAFETDCETDGEVTE
ncbi:hypothetical protein [Mobilibacterium timonense]|uniref:hypothetical protein n=1 Tax=Mobilibacterium timonense TaxID=1871012 RepID=UPI001F28FE4C|nr:hypothetical protein [Mobilibacterium timonense]